MTDEKIKEEARQVLTSYLAGKRLRKTPERFAILDRVFDMGGHFCIDSLFSSLESSSYHVCRATLYNCLQLFEEAGLVRKHRFDGQPTQYERCVPVSGVSHYHLVCRCCGKVKEAKAPDAFRDLSQVKSRTFTPEYFTIYVYGVCSTCQRKRKKVKKS